MNDYDEYEPASDHDPRPTFGEWLGQISPTQQVGYGCLFIVIISAMMMYCGGTASLLVRPMLLQRSPTATLMPTSTRAPTATLPPPTFLILPTGRPPATPTQAPIPTREPTATPTLLGSWPTVPITGTVFVTPSVTGRITPTLTPTRRVTGTGVPKP